jgi:hypothetical protein
MDLGAIHSRLSLRERPVRSANGYYGAQTMSHLSRISKHDGAVSDFSTESDQRKTPDQTGRVDKSVRMIIDQFFDDVSTRHQVPGLSVVRSWTSA